MNITAKSRTDAGRLRSNNEDSVLSEPPLIAVADGMGGHAHGEVASNLAVEVLRSWKERLAGRSGLEAAAALREAFLDANATVFAKGNADEKLAGMGTTLTAGWVTDDTLAIAHVGDSRAYLLREGKLEQLTEDQTVVQEMVRRGRISAAEAATSPQRHIVLQAIGVDADELDIETASVPLRPGDRIVLASDGLFGMVTDSEQLRDILVAHADPDEACDALIRAANEAGGQDNISVVILDVEGAPSAAGDGGGGIASIQIDRTTPRPSPPPETPGRRFSRSVIVAVGAFLLLVVMGGVLLLWPSGPSYVVAASDSDVVLLDGRTGNTDKPAEGKIVHTFTEKVDDFAEPTQRQLRIGYEVESPTEADALVQSLPRKLGPQDTPTPPPTPPPTPSIEPPLQSTKPKPTPSP